MIDYNEQEGFLVLLALMVLVVVMALGVGVAHMYLRGSDVSAEFLDRGESQVPKNLAELGFRFGRSELRKKGCVTPSPATRTLNVSGLGTVTVVFTSLGSGYFRIVSTGSNGEEQSNLTCALFCSPPQHWGGADDISDVSCQ